MTPVFDLTIRIVEGYGFLPIVTMDGQDVYRGEFHTTPREALPYAEAAYLRLMPARKMEAAS